MYREQEDALFSMLNLPPKSQISDHIDVEKSMFAHHLGDSLGCCPTQCCIYRDILGDWAGSCPTI